MTFNTIPVAKNKEGRWLFPETSPRGDACEALCISCEAPLTNRKGAIKKPHFAHIGNRSKTQGGQRGCSEETILHACAKKIVAEPGTLMVPNERLFQKASSNPVEDLIAESIKYDWLNGAIQIERGEVEKPIGGIQPDATIETTSGEKIAIEIYVSHKDKSKREAYKQLDLLALEIDLSNEPRISSDTWDFENLRRKIRNSVNNKDWLNSPMTTALRELIKTTRTEGEELLLQTDDEAALVNAWAETLSKKGLKAYTFLKRIPAYLLLDVNRQNGKIPESWICYIEGTEPKKKPTATKTASEAGRPHKVIILPRKGSFCKTIDCTGKETKGDLTQCEKCKKTSTTGSVCACGQAEPITVEAIGDTGLTALKIKKYLDHLKGKIPTPKLWEGIVTEEVQRWTRVYENKMTISDEASDKLGRMKWLLPSWVDVKTNRQRIQEHFPNGIQLREPKQ